MPFSDEYFHNTRVADLEDAWEAEGQSLARKHLAGLAGRHLPDDDPESVADVLLSQPDHPDYDDLLGRLDAAIVQSAQGHPRGITADERKALGGNWVMPDYLLGPGDQQAYAALRDSNLLNAVTGRQHVKNIDELIGGSNYAEVDGMPANATLAEAGHDFEHASQMPTKHSTMLGSPYRQHRTFGDIGTERSTIRNTWDNNRDGVLGQFLSALNKWELASKRASRAPGSWTSPDSNWLLKTAGGIGKWASNFGPELVKAEDQKWAEDGVSRASPLVPNKVSDPQMRSDSIENLKHFSAQAGDAPDVFEYGKSHGVGYSKAEGWLGDMAHQGADPITAANLLGGFVPQVAMKVAGNAAGRGLTGAGAGLLKSLADDIPRHLAGEARQEAFNPMTLSVGALTFPKVADAFSRTTVSPEEQAKAAQQLEEQHARTNDALKTIRAAKRDY